LWPMMLADGDETSVSRTGTRNKLRADSFFQSETVRES
jgi:hypothetical protein